MSAGNHKTDKKLLWLAVAAILRQKQGSSSAQAESRQLYTGSVTTGLSSQTPNSEVSYLTFCRQINLLSGRHLGSLPTCPDAPKTVTCNLNITLPTEWLRVKGGRPCGTCTCSPLSRQRLQLVFRSAALAP